MTYQDWLAHHGIKGMKWGKLNGPPYPLSDKQRSSAEKRLNPSVSKKVKANDGGLDLRGGAAKKYKTINENAKSYNGPNSEIKNESVGAAAPGKFVTSGESFTENDLQNGRRICSSQSKSNLKRYYPDLFNKFKGLGDKSFLTETEKSLVSTLTEGQLGLSYPSLYEFYYGRKSKYANKYGH